jgi:hypothetical protein
LIAKAKKPRTTNKSGNHQEEILTSKYFSIQSKAQNAKKKAGNGISQCMGEKEKKPFGEKTNELMNQMIPYDIKNNRIGKSFSIQAREPFKTNHQKKRPNYKTEHAITYIILFIGTKVLPIR